MKAYTRPLPQLSEAPFLTDGGMETTFVFHQGIDLPHFASIVLMKNAEGRKVLRDYYSSYAALAAQREVGFILESPTWRGGRGWAESLGYSQQELAGLNRDAIGLMHEIREEFETASSPMVVSGCVGPRGDGYQPDSAMTVQESANYHSTQLQVLRDAGAEIAAGFTINTVEEAFGMAEAGAALDFPIVISFTLEIDGELPTGQSLQEAIEIIDSQSTRPPAYYMINCAHPTHFADRLVGDGAWRSRIRGLRANASMRSHEELDNSADLDAGNPEELGSQYRNLCDLLPALNIFGGCCGTDLRHVEAISNACLSPAVA